jgi:hypothetical protein
MPKSDFDSVCQPDRYDFTPEEAAKAIGMEVRDVIRVREKFVDTLAREARELLAEARAAEDDIRHGADPETREAAVYTRTVCVSRAIAVMCHPIAGEILDALPFVMDQATTGLVQEELQHEAGRAEGERRPKH